jgi:hypothetical protein
MDQKSSLDREGAMRPAHLKASWLLLVSFLVGPPAIGSSHLEGNRHWWDGFGRPGMEDDVSELIEYRGDLIAAGLFRRTSDGLAYHIARWDGGAWQPMEVGLAGTEWVEVWTLTIHEGDLYVGGLFDVPSHSVARWDGSQWEAFFPGLEGRVWALASFDGKLYASGESDGDYTPWLAVWNGVEWTPMEASPRGPVYGFTVYGGRLVAGGGFTSAGSTSVSNIAAWDGETWSPLGLGTDEAVLALAVHEDRLVAGGPFRQAGTVACEHVAEWDGDSWRPLGDGLAGSVRALASSPHGLVAGGYSPATGGTAISNIACWDGESWRAVDSGTNGPVDALAAYGDGVAVGGEFTRAGSTPANHVALWDGDELTSLGRRGHGLEGEARTAVVYGGELIVGGDFADAGGLPANRIAAWDGEKWRALGEGLTDGVLVLATFGDALIAGGGFEYAGSVPARHVAGWDGRSWYALGAGVEGRVVDLAIFNGQLIACHFSQIDWVSKLSRWNGVDWVDIAGADAPGWIGELEIYGDKLVAAGLFPEIGGLPARNLAAWDGLTWQELGGGADRGVYMLKAHEGKLIVGGEFSRVGEVDAELVAAWDGVGWSGIGDGFQSDASWDRVLTAGLYGGQLVVGGYFRSGVRWGLARWDGESWQPMGSGVRELVSGVIDFRGELYVLGAFDRAGDKLSCGIARWNDDVDFDAPELMTFNRPAPNPFRGETLARFSNKFTSRVRVSVFDVRGRRVATLVDEILPAGVHERAWDGRDAHGRLLRSGVYYMRVETGAEAASRTVVLAR